MIMTTTQAKELNVAINPALRWLETLISSPNVTWSLGQKAAAIEALAEARAILPDVDGPLRVKLTGAPQKVATLTGFRTFSPINQD